MENDMEKETQELAQMLEEAAEAERLAEQKEEAKVWGRSIPASRSLLDFLCKLTKDEMCEIAVALELTNYKSLKKKELAEYISQPILEAAKGLFTVLDKAQYDFFKKLCASDGLCTDMTAVSSSLPHFIDLGLVFPGTVKKQRVLALPAEIGAVFTSMASSELLQKAVSNTELIQIAGGILFYYGVLTLNELAEHIGKLAGAKVDERALAELLCRNAVFTSDTIRQEGDVFLNPRVFDYGKVQAEQSMRPDIWFYPLTLEAALAAGTPSFVERTPAFQAFSKFLQERYEAEAEDADDIAAECAFAFRMGESVGNVIEYLGDMIEIKGAKDLKQITAKIAELSGTTRQWGLKGYTPLELRKAQNNLSNVLMPEPAGDIEDIDYKKVGRNQPCPCGSGKKFKKCCGIAL